MLEAIERGRRSLALEDALPDDLREQARADGVFDKTAADTVKEAVTLFEVFTPNQVETRVAEHAEIIRNRGRGVFQRLNDVAAMFAEHTGAAISACVPETIWSRHQLLFSSATFSYKQEVVIEQYVQRVPYTMHQIGQQLVLSRDDAEQALNALEAVIHAVAVGN